MVAPGSRWWLTVTLWHGKLLVSTVNTPIIWSSRSINVFLSQPQNHTTPEFGPGKILQRPLCPSSSWLLQCLNTCDQSGLQTWPWWNLLPCAMQGGVKKHGPSRLLEQTELHQCHRHVTNCTFYGSRFNTVVFSHPCQYKGIKTETVSSVNTVTLCNDL